MDSAARSEEAAMATADEMFAKRGCCCIWVPWTGARSGKDWERMSPPAADRGRRRSWWIRGLDALMKVREWSELLAGPRWKTFIRRFRGRRRYAGKPGGRFGYDPISYARNFDEGQGSDSDCDTVRRGFSARYATPPGSTKSSMDLGGRDAPQIIFEEAH